MQAPPAEQASSFGHSVTSMLVHGDRTKPVDPVTQVRVHFSARHESGTWSMQLLGVVPASPAAAET